MGIKTRGLKGKRRLKAQFRDWTSLSSWWLFATNAIGKFANQSAILSYAVFEFSCSGFATWFYLAFKEVALNGWIVTSWKVYVICLFFRLLCSVLGLLAAFRRNAKFLRYYLVAMLPNIIFSAWAIVSLAGTSCHCVNFLQCQALIAFMKDHRPFIINPHPPPDHELWEQRLVPYAEPPDEEVAIRVWRAWTRDSIFNDSSDRIDTTARDPAISNKTLQSASQPNPATRHLHYLKDFVVTSSSLAWVANVKQCSKDLSPNDPYVASDFMDGLIALQSNKVPKLSVFKPAWNDMFVHLLGDSLHNCVLDPRCGVLRLILLEGMRFRICSLPYPTVPIPAKSAKSTLRPLFVMHLQKHHIRAQQDTAIISNHMAGEQLDNKPPEVAWRKLHDIFEDSCRCLADFPTPEKAGCQVWNDGKRWRSWCVVEEKSLASCISSGIAVHKQMVVNGVDYYWSEDLCKKRGCKCAGLGLPPAPMNNNVVKDLLVGETGFNYGRTCKKWDVEDEEAWCYVGFDTTCPDRRLDIIEARNVDGKLEKVTQYYSAYACIRDHQMTTMRSYQDRCQAFIFTVSFVLVVLNVVSLPMFILVYKFLNYRCGDHFAVVEEFAVQFSSDDEQDDFDLVADEASRSFRQDKYSQKIEDKDLAESFLSQDKSVVKAFQSEHKSAESFQSEDAEDQSGCEER